MAGLAVLLAFTLLPLVAEANSQFSQPRITAVSATCATVEFQHTDGAHEEPLNTAYVFAKKPKDKDFGQWGKAVSLLKVDSAQRGGQTQNKYHALMRDLPAGADFEIRLSGSNNIFREDASPMSKIATTKQETAAPAAPSNVQVRRTDLRINHPKHSGSVCVDLEWAHPNLKLARHPTDAYFRVLYQYKGEGSSEFCQDVVGALDHQCGERLADVNSKLPASFATICGLRPQRWIRFTVEAFNCDSPAALSPGGNRSGTSLEHVDVVLPPSAPSVITTLVTQPGNQEAVAGFHPKAILNWIPQPGTNIAGHAIYLGLVSLDAIKLLCWVPHDGSKYAEGHMEMPVVHKNHTFSKDTLLLQDYLNKFHVHHEQELIVTTRTTERLESPAYVHRLGEWLVIQDSVKCLSSFEATHPSYVSRDKGLAWTQEAALSLYD